MRKAQNKIPVIAMLVLLALACATGMVAAEDLNPDTVKTIYIKLHYNDVTWFTDPMMLDMIRTVDECASLPLPPPPAPITLFKNPGNATKFIDMETDIYWSGTHLARYRATTEYNLKGPGCTWEKKVIRTGELIDYKNPTGVIIDYQHNVFHPGKGLYRDINPALRQKEDVAYPGMVKGSDTIAGQKCDVVVDPKMIGWPITEYEKCVLSDMHRFPGTNNWIELKTRVLGANGNQFKFMRVEQATAFEVNVPIPDEKFKLPPGFTLLR